MKPPAALKQGFETILLVEDDAGVRELVRSMLVAQGYTVLAAELPRDVESLCEKHSGSIHLLLTDMILPGVSGREIANRVGLLRPKIKVLYMSGYTDDVLIQGHGFDETSAFLQKPFSQAGLATKVRAVLDADGFNHL
jgi:hypothetical protein